MTIDLSQIPAPDVIEPLSFEVILAELKTDFIDRWPDVADTIDLESDPVVKLLEVAAYRELILRARINDAARACMLAYAVEADLDNLAALLGVSRLPNESDDRMRHRTQLSLEGLSTAGPVRSYEYHALSASADVRDVCVSSQTPGSVTVVVLAEPSDQYPFGLPDAALLTAVEQRLSSDDIRPLTDSVDVVAAEILPYTVSAALIVASGPDAAIIRAAAIASLMVYIDQQFGLGLDITISGLHQALHRQGVTRVDLTQPAASLTVLPTQAARCTGYTVTLGGVGV